MKPAARSRVVTDDRAAVWLIVAAIVLSVCAVYWQVRHFGFINYDDNLYVTQNPAVFRGLSWSSMVWAFTQEHASNWHPITWMSHMLDCQLFGLNAGAHHLVNVAFHCANAVLVFLVLRSMTARMWSSAFVAGLFALHPLHVESVAWISERKDVLSTLFWLLTLAAYVRYVRRGGAGTYLLLILAFAFGLMSKPMLVTLPFTLLLFDYWPLARFDGATRKTRSLIIEKIPLLLLSAVSSAVTFAAQLKEAVAPVNELSVAQRLVNALTAYVDYVIMMFWPTKLAILYPLSVEIRVWKLVTAIVFLIGFSLAAYQSRRSRPYLLVGWLWYLGTLVPVIGLVQVGNQSLADRYTYVPLIGIFIIIAWGAAEIAPKLKIPRALVASVGCLALVTCAGTTWKQAAYWKDSATLFQRALAVTKNNSVLMNNLGATLAALGRLDDAIALYNEALRLNPDYANAHNNLGVALVSLGRVDEALVHYDSALRLNPDYPEVLGNIGLALQKKGRLPEAVEYFRRALHVSPSSAEAHANLGLALASQGNNAEAASEYEAALALRPAFVDVHNNYGVLLKEIGRNDAGIEQFRRALAIDPASLEAHFNFGDALIIQGRFDDAAAHFTEALRIATASNRSDVVKIIQDRLQVCRARKSGQQPAQ